MNAQAVAVAPDVLRFPIGASTEPQEAVTTAIADGIASLSYTYVDPTSAIYRAVAETFARKVSDIEGVESVWLTGIVDDLEMAIVINPASLDRELEIRGIFIDVVCEHLDPQLGELAVYPSDAVAGWVASGTCLS